MWPGLLNRTRCTDLLESWCLVPWLIRCSWTLRAAPICHRSKAGGGGGRIGNRDGRGGRTTAGTANREHGWAADGTCPLGGSRLGASELGGGLAWCIAPSVRIAPNSEYTTGVCLCLRSVSGLSLGCLSVSLRFSVLRSPELGSVGGGARARGGDEHFTSPPTSEVPPRFRKRTLRVSATESDSRGAPRWGEEGRAAVLENAGILGGGGRRSSWSGGRSGKALGVVMALTSAGEAAACSWGYRKVGSGLGGRVGKSAPSGGGGTSRRPGTGCALGDEVVVPQRAPDWAQCLSCVVEDHAAMVWST